MNTRTLDHEKVVVMTNLTAENATWDGELDFSVSANNLWLANCEVEDHEAVSNLVLKPFEARVYVVR